METSDSVLVKHLLRLIRRGETPPAGKEEVRFDLHQAKQVRLARPAITFEGQAYQQFLVCEGQVDGQPCELYAVGELSGDDPDTNLLDGVTNLGRLSMMLVLTKVQILGDQVHRMVGLIGACSRYMSSNKLRLHEPFEP